MNERDGYVVAEASVLLSLASILFLLLVYLCSYLYQACYMNQAAYVAAFRGSRNAEGEETFVHQQLDELLEREIWSFSEEERQIHISPFWVQVSLKKQTPFSRWTNTVPELAASWRAAVRDPVAYIRGRRRLAQMGDGQK